MKKCTLFYHFLQLQFKKMKNNELVEMARRAMKDLSASNMLEHEQNV